MSVGKIHADSRKQRLFKKLAGAGKLSLDRPAAEGAYYRQSAQRKRKLYPLRQRRAALLDAGVFL